MVKPGSSPHLVQLTSCSWAVTPALTCYDCTVWQPTSPAQAPKIFWLTHSVLKQNQFWISFQYLKTKKSHVKNKKQTKKPDFPASLEKVIKEPGNIRPTFPCGRNWLEQGGAALCRKGWCSSFLSRPCPACFTQFPFQPSLHGHLYLRPRLWEFVQRIHYLSYNKCLEKWKDIPEGEFLVSGSNASMPMFSHTTVSLPRFSPSACKLLIVSSITWKTQTNGSRLRITSARKPPVTVSRVD